MMMASWLIAARGWAGAATSPRPGAPEPEPVTGTSYATLKVTRSISEGRAAAGGPTTTTDRGLALAAGLGLVALAFALYLWTAGERFNFYNHFVWQADAFLAGRVWIPFPVEGSGGMPGNAYFNDVFPLLDAAGQPTGRVLIPFPPLPAIVIVPFVAVWGLATDQELLGIVLGTFGVAAAWWMLGRLRIGLGVRVVTAVFFATGTAWWWSAAVASTWYFAHLVAVLPALLAVGVGLRADRRAIDGDEQPAPDPHGVDEDWDDRPPSLAQRVRDLLDDALPLDRSQILAGLLLGIAATARLPLVFAAPFFMLVGGGGTWQRRTLSAGVGGFVPVAMLLAYTYLTTGAFLHPGYDYQYRLEAWGYPTLGYNPDWAVEDVRYVPQNLGIMLASLPAFLPDVLPNTLRFSPDVPVCVEPGAVRGLFDISCPIAVPRDIGTSILLTSPAYLLALFPLARRPWTRLVLGSLLATLAIALFNLAHFSQGWVQWGYRFSNDFVPFLLPLVALGAAAGARGVRSRPRALAIVLVVAGAAVNLWGVTWGGILGW